MKISRSRFLSKSAPVYCAVFAVVLARPALWPQSPAVPTANNPFTGVMPPDASGHPTIVNKDFTYPGIELWDPTK